MDMMSSPYGTSVCERMASRVKSPSDLIRCALGILGSPSTQMTRWHPLSQTHRKLYVVYLFFTVQTLLFVYERWLLIGGSGRRMILHPRWTDKRTLEVYKKLLFVYISVCKYMYTETLLYKNTLWYSTPSLATKKIEKKIQTFFRQCTVFVFL